MAMCTRYKIKLYSFQLRFIVYILISSGHEHYFILCKLYVISYRPTLLTLVEQIAKGGLLYLIHIISSSSSPHAKSLCYYCNLISYKDHNHNFTCIYWLSNILWQMGTIIENRIPTYGMES